MNLTLSGHHVEITEALDDFCRQKLAKLEHYFDHINRISVILTVEKSRQIAEATLYVNGGELHASAEQTDMYAAIDSLIDKLAGQVIKHKDKLKHH